MTMAEAHYFVDVLVLLAAVVIVVPLSQRLGLGSVLGFLVAGALVGPWGLGFIVEVDEIRHLAEFGVVFLLFIIGIELKPSRLWVMRNSVFGLGTVQVVVTGFVITLAAMALGMASRPALVTGFGLALSSTAFALQILGDKGDLGTAYGRSAFAILLLQDLVVVPLIALLPLLADIDRTITEDVELAVLESLAIVVAVFALGRVLIHPVLSLVAGSRQHPEVFTATAILLVLGAAWLTEWAGLSMALGAFLGGLLLADSRYRHQIMADLQPFRGLLLGLFFMSVGMSINFGLLGHQGALMAGLVAGLLLLKALLLWGLCRVTGRSHTESLQVALLLAQAGEFGFILFGLANMLGVLDEELLQMLLLVIALSMAITPLLVKLSPLLTGTQALQPTGAVTPAPEPVTALRNHIIIAGYGRFGQYLGRVLGKVGIAYQALEIKPERVARGRALGYPVFYGDATRMQVLRSAGAANAAMLVYTLGQGETAARAVAATHETFPNLPVYARAWDVDDALALRAMGADYVIPEVMAASLQLARDVLEASDVPPELAARMVEEFYRREQNRLVKPARPKDWTGFSDMLLVLSPGDDEVAILEHAATLAQSQRAGLTVVEVITAAPQGVKQGVALPEDLEESMVDGRRVHLDSLVAPWRERIELHTAVLVGRPHEQIVREVASNDRDLVLKTPEKVRGLRSRSLSREDTRLLRTAPCPVLLVKSIPAINRFRRVLAAVYLDEFPPQHRYHRHAVNRRVLEYAVLLAAAQLSELHVVYAWEAYGEQDLRSGRSPYHWDADAYVEREQKRSQELLNGLLKEVQGTLESQVSPAFRPITHLVKGSPRDEIPRLATDLKADLVVVGSAARTGVSRLIMESTAEVVAEKATCSVLFIKPPGFVTPVVVEV